MRTNLWRHRASLAACTHGLSRLRERRRTRSLDETAGLSLEANGRIRGLEPRGTVRLPCLSKKSQRRDRTQRTACPSAATPSIVPPWREPATSLRAAERQPSGSPMPSARDPSEPDTNPDPVAALAVAEETWQETWDSAGVGRRSWACAVACRARRARVFGERQRSS